MIDRAESFSWRTALVCALLWGIAVSLADVLTQPVSDLDSGALLDFTLGRLWQWIPTGCVWVLGSKLIARGRWVALRVLLLLPVALATPIAVLTVSPMESFAGGVLHDAMGSPPPLDLAVFVSWTNGFFGGLYVLGYLATRRATRCRRRLAEVRLAQSEADTLIREARINAYRGQLQPGMLLAALDALRQRYGEDKNAGDRLFDLLIGFLRAAMPSVRSGFSTLSAELETVRSYAELRGALGVKGPAWKLDLPNEVPGLPFPSLILLPALDELSGSLSADAELRLVVVGTANGAVLRVAADRAASLSDAVDRRLRGGLALTFGSSATVSASPALPVEIRLRAQALGRRSDAYPRQIGDGDEAVPRVHRRQPFITARDR